MIKRKMPVSDLRVLVMGFTFKENCPDTRNTKVADVVAELRDVVGAVEIYDPVADVELTKHEYGVTLTNDLPKGPFDTLVLAVKHDEIVAMGEKGMRALLKQDGLIYDVKGVLPANASSGRL
jgi:UDP-N-acetyl-D-galactosamine dehydrogenase